MTQETPELTKLRETARMQLKLTPEDREFLGHTGFDPEIGDLALRHFGEEAIAQLAESEGYGEGQEKTLDQFGHLLSRGLRTSKEKGLDSLNRATAWADLNYGSDKTSLVMNAGTLSYWIGKGEVGQIIRNVKVKEQSWGITEDGKLPSHLEHTGYIPIENLIGKDKQFLAELRKMFEAKNIGQTVYEIDQVADEGGKYRWDKQNGQYVEVGK